MMFVPRRKHTYGPPQPVTGRALLIIYVNDVPASQEAHLRASTACYEESFAYIYVNDVPASQEAHLRASTACYDESFAYYICE
jgi:hypothetical protein